MADHTPTTATPPGRVLVVDDEQPLAQMVASYLIRAGFDTRQAHTGTQAVDETRRFSPDVVVLDLGLPELDGLEVCRRIRTFSDCYILMLTARGSEDDKISGLTLGADDYITKPFSIRELVTRVHAVLRRPRTSTTPPQVTTPLIVGDLILDPVAHQVRVEETIVELTRTEFELLVALALRPGQALTRQTWSPRSGTPPGSVMNASSMSTSATCVASSAPTPGAGGLSTPCVAWATGWGSHESRTRPDLPLPGRPGVGRGD